jgi:hypothetical protein
VLVVNVTLSNYEAFLCTDVSIQVTVRNEGSYTEKFNVTLYVNQSSITIPIDTYLVTSLGSSDQVTIPFLWTVRDVPVGECRVTAEATPVSWEINTSNNYKDVTLLINPDYTAPVIGVPIQNPPGGEIWQGSGVRVQVNVTDAGSGVKTVLLSWKVENQSDVDDTIWWNITMSKFNPDTLPQAYSSYAMDTWGYSSGAKISYKILAYDFTGNEAVRDHAGTFYIFVIVPEYQIALILPLFMAATLSIVIGWKKRTRAC